MPDALAVLLLGGSSVSGLGYWAKGTRLRVGGPSSWHRQPGAYRAQELGKEENPEHINFTPLSFI